MNKFCGRNFCLVCYILQHLLFTCIQDVYFHTSNACNYMTARLFQAKVMNQRRALQVVTRIHRQQEFLTSRTHIMFTKIVLGRTCSDFYFHFIKSGPARFFCLTSIVCKEQTLHDSTGTISLMSYLSQC